MELNQNVKPIHKRQIHLPIPVFILLILLIIALAAFSGYFAFLELFKSNSSTSPEWVPPPIIYIAGYHGNKLYIEGHDIEYPTGLQNCRRNIPLRLYWPSPFLSNETECELFLLSMEFNSTTGQFQNAPGVKIHAKLPETPFGSTFWPMECNSIQQDNSIDECYFNTFKSSEMQKLPHSLRKLKNYVVGKNLFLAPYDWRQPLVNSPVMDEFFANLQQLIKHAVQLNGKRAIIMGLSMGTLVVNKFVRNMSKNWQNQFLSSSIMVSPPFGGTVASLPAILEQFPDNWPYPNVTDAQLHTMERSLGSTAMFLPRESAFGDEVFLTIDDLNFTAKDVREIFGYSKLDHFWPFYDGDEPGPQKELPMHCFYGHGMGNTPRRYILKRGEKPMIEMGDGDGLVNIQSLRICVKWRQMGFPVTVHEYANQSHAGFAPESLLEEIMQILLEE